MPSVDVDDVALARMIRVAVQAAIERSQARARIPTILTGTVEAVDDETGDQAFVRLDQQAMASDPTQSDNWDNAGVLPMTQLGQSTLDEPVRVTFNGSAGGSAMRTGFAGVDLSLDIDSTQGIIRFLAGETVVGYMDAAQWELGVAGSALVRLDPLGGLRLRDGSDVLRAQLSATEGLILREALTGVSGVLLGSDGLIVLDPDTGDRISITSGETSSTPTPHWASSASTVDPSGTTHGSPAVASFGTGDDIDIRFVAASDNSDLGAGETWTPPASYTERADFYNNGPNTLGVSVATRDPALASPGIANFTSTESNWSRRLAHSVIVRGGGGTSPAYEDISVGTVLASSSTTVILTITPPVTTSVGSMLLVHVAMCGPAIPVGWVTPEGWKQLGVNVAGIGAAGGHILASGIWYKIADAADAAGTPQAIEINMGGAAGFTKFQATAVSIQNPYAFPAGLDIRRNNRSMPRGLVASASSSADSAVWSTGTATFPATDLSITGIDVQAGRTYRIAFQAPLYTRFASSPGTGIVGIAIQLDEGAGYGNFHRTQRLENPGAGITSRGEVSISKNYVPAADDTIGVRVQVSNDLTGAGHNFQFLGGGLADHTRILSIEDIGAEF